LSAAAGAVFDLAADLFAAAVLAAPGLFAIEEFAIDELVITAAFEMFVTDVTLDTVLAGLTALFEFTGELPHAAAMANIAKSDVVSRTLIFIKLFPSYSPPRAADRQSVGKRSLFESNQAFKSMGRHFEIPDRITADKISPRTQ